MRESPTQSGFPAAVVQVGDESGRIIAMRAEKPGECGVGCIERHRPVGGQLMGPPPSQEAAMRRESPWCGRESLVEPHSPAGQSLEVGRSPAAVAVKTQVPGPHGVPDDQEHVPAIGRTGRQAGHGPVLRPGRSAERQQHDDQQQSDEHRKCAADESEERPAARADQPGGLNAKPPRQQQRRPRVPGVACAHRSRNPTNESSPTTEPMRTLPRRTQAIRASAIPGSSSRTTTPTGMSQR